MSAPDCDLCGFPCYAVDGRGEHTGRHSYGRECFQAAYQAACDRFSTLPIVKPAPRADEMISRLPLLELSEPLSLRDRFAAAAMQGLLAGVPWPTFNEFEISNLAFTVADAMLAARGDAK